MEGTLPNSFLQGQHHPDSQTDKMQQKKKTVDHYL
jgi:hypothetical protein